MAVELDDQQSVPVGGFNFVVPYGVGKIDGTFECSVRNF